MQMMTPPVKQTLAVLNNVSSLHFLATTLIQRPHHLPGIGVFSGWSGMGKTYASVYTQNKTGAIRIEVGESWTKKTFLTRLLNELGQEPKGTISDLVEQAAMALEDDPNRPLLIDEADKLVDKNHIEIVRELHDASGVPTILIGEEQLPQKLAKWERIHNRVLRWEFAQPCDEEDTRELARMFCDGIELSEDLIGAVRAHSEGRARRIVVNLSRIAEVANNQGKTNLDLAEFESRSGGWYTSTTPRRGRA
ncbi:AAA family ATPase [Amorphus coralli]|uniref:AAA family ATPase n=1 Tax=Amorphus coralli TaxID=340680 RepID=UPI000368A518|nr:ATP-binding protein [Amorphus coralli]